MEHVYFVSYFDKSRDGSGFGNCEVITHTPIENISDLHEAAKSIKQQSGRKEVIILYFNLLRTENF